MRQFYNLDKSGKHKTQMKSNFNKNPLKSYKNTHKAWKQSGEWLFIFVFNLKIELSAARHGGRSNAESKVY